MNTYRFKVSINEENNYNHVKFNFQLRIMKRLSKILKMYIFADPSHRRMYYLLFAPRKNNRYSIFM